MNHPLRPKTHRSLGVALAVAGAILATSGRSPAQTQVYFQDFDTDSTANWVVNQAGNGVNVADFYFDYSTVGIPSAPHSVGGTTRGLRLIANLPPGTTFPAGISVCPLNFGITENFDMHFDFWLNYNGASGTAGNGTTEIGGAGYGTAGTTAQVAGTVADSVFIGATMDGGSSADYRVYASTQPASYQDGTYQITGNASSGYVYAGTNRNNSGGYYTSHFPATPCPQAQTNLYHQQTGLTAPAGTIAFKWHDVSLKKVANTITYSIDGVLIATVNAVDAGNLASTNILFNCFDSNGSASTDPNATNLLFALFDNVRITNFPTVVSVQATTANASPAGPVQGVFALTRNAAGTPLTVNYTMSGTAVRGTDYSLWPASAGSGSVTFAATATTTNITVNPLGTSVPGPTRTAIMTVNTGPGYAAGVSDTVYIADTNTPTIDLSLLRGQMYERLTNDYARFVLTRRGDLNQSFDVNVSYSGSAVGGADYFPVPSVHFDAGIMSSNLDVHPIDNSVLNNPRTVTVSLSSGTGYNIGINTPLTASILDDETPPETVLWSDALTNDTSANWTVWFASTNSDNPDFTLNWGYDYSALSLPPAPHSGTDTRGLQMTVNKNGANGGAAGLNLYPTGQRFSGNYALRFDMYLIEGTTGATEDALFGINHDGAHTNWLDGSFGVPAGWAFDGLFYHVEADGATQLGGDYGLHSSPYLGTGPTLLASEVASDFTAIFKSPPWTAGLVGGGVPANLAASTSPCWADVEVRQIGNVVTLAINRTVILSYTNTTGYTSGNIMLGYDDPYDSVGSANASVIFANARVISLASPVIKNILANGSNLEITFLVNSGDGAGQFTLQQSAPLATGAYADTSSTITSLGGGYFKAVKAVGASPTFYRVRRIY